MVNISINGLFEFEHESSCGAEIFMIFYVSVNTFCTIEILNLAQLVGFRQQLRNLIIFMSLDQ